MTFEEILDQAIAMLQRRGRVTYRALKLQFRLDAEQLGALKEELLYAHPGAVEEEGQGLVWSGGTSAAPVLPPTHLAEVAERQEASSAPDASHPPSLMGRKRNVVSSWYCSVTWWSRPPSRNNSTPRNCARWCAPIKRCAPP